MIKVKDGYAKLIGTTYQGSATQVLLSNGGDLEYSASSKANTLVQRNASQHIYATYFNSAISDEALTDIGSVYVRNTSDTFIRRVSKTQFYSILDDKFVTLDTTQSITGAKTFSTSVRFANNASIIQNQNDTSNYTTILKWYKNGASRNTYDPSIGQHNTGGDGNGSICILPYPTETSPWGGTVGLFISKGVLKLDGKSVALAENYYTKTESDERYVGGNKTANHGSSGTAYTADTYSSTFVNKAFVAFAERGSWAYANNGYVSTDTGVNIPLAGTAIFQWGDSDTNKTQLYITPHNNSEVSNPAADEMLFYTSNGSGYTSAWTRVLTHRNYTAYINPANFAKGNAGASNRGVYVTNGTVTAMTYYLNATVNSGASGKLAYYRGTTSIDDYTDTIGSSSTPIYINNGIPSAADSCKIVKSGNYFSAFGITGYIYVVRYGQVVCVSINMSSGGNGSTGTATLLTNLPSAVYITGQSASKGGGSALRWAAFYVSGTTLYVYSSQANQLPNKVSFTYITNSLNN